MRSSTLQDRWQRVRTNLIETGADAIVLGGGADLAYLTGYEAMPLERLTAFVARVDDDVPTLVVPALEVARVEPVGEAFTIIGWGDGEDPADVVGGLIGPGGTTVISDDLWAMHVLALMTDERRLRTVSDALGGIRAIKTAEERTALRRVGGLADQVMAMIQTGSLQLVGRTEADIAAEIADQLCAVGHDRAQFVIVASGANSASPHHHPGDRVVQRDEMVLFDFGGLHAGFNSDTTRCVFTGPIPDEVGAAYDALMVAQQAAVDAAVAGNRLCDVDAAARDTLAAHGHGDAFIHRTGHGIGTEVHEQPYVTADNTDTVMIGHAFSIEPGVYYEGRWGMRLEDIVVIGDDGVAIRCNESDRRLVSVA